VKRFGWQRGWVIAASLVIVLLMASCGSSDYHVFSLREGIGHFSVEYPSACIVTRIDIRNDITARYTDVGLSSLPDAGAHGLNEISVYAWPAGPGDETASLILDNMLDHAGGIFLDFNILDRYSVMLGDIEGQAARFSWDAAASVNATGLSSLPAVSTMVCFRHGDVAWEIHVASAVAAQMQAETEFQHIIDTFQILP
jgi:hypothetical protein